MKIDALQLKRAFLNLLDNADSYTPSNGKNQLQLIENEQIFHFSVIDLGKGFQAESFKIATKEFYTEEKSRTDTHYGLGLNFTKQVAELHGGNLSLGNRDDGEAAIVVLQIVK